MAEPEESKEPAVYTLPAPIAAALSSGRGFLVRNYAKELMDPDPKNKMKIKPSELGEVFRLLGDLIDDNYKLKTQHSEFHGAVQTQVAEKLVQIVNDIVHLRTDMQEIVKDFKP